MKKRTIGFMLVVFVAILVITFSWTQVISASKYSAILPNPPTPASEDEMPRVKRLDAEMSATEGVSKESTVTQVADPYADVDEVINEVQELAQRYQDQILNNSGWLHLVSEYHETPDQTGSFPDNNPIPSDYIMDSWYLLNTGGKVDKVVSIMKDLNGQNVQESIYLNGIWRNLTFKFEESDDNPGVNLDFEFGDKISKFHDGWYTSLKLQEEQQDDKTVLVVNAAEEFEEAVKFAGYNEPVVEVDERAYYDHNTGQLLRLERVLLTESGEEIVAGSLVISIIERTEPPTDILELLNSGGTK